jgi:hypothetical protein
MCQISYKISHFCMATNIWSFSYWVKPRKLNNSAIKFCSLFVYYLPDAAAIDDTSFENSLRDIDRRIAIVARQQEITNSQSKFKNS